MQNLAFNSPQCCAYIKITAGEVATELSALVTERLQTETSHQSNASQAALQWIINFVKLKVLIFLFMASIQLYVHFFLGVIEW